MKYSKPKLEIKVVKMEGEIANILTDWMADTGLWDKGITTYEYHS